ncbi:winged helix-turn-helix transcriptional regulator [Micrococcaceae bacterium RIT802]|nr:winged helix-turn-helix transcriptional regulator [Micrococcaceae bacterium RIT 802]
MQSPPPGKEEAPEGEPAGQAAGEYRSLLISSLTRVLGEWTAPEFLSSVVAREGIHLDPPAIVVVTILAQDGPQRPSSLAARLVTGASNISKIIKRLGETGLAVRGADPQDARAHLVRLTPAGHRIASAFVRAGDGLVDELLAGWNEADRLAFVSLLQRFEAATVRLSAQLSADAAPAPTGEEPHHRPSGEQL